MPYTLAHGGNCEDLSSALVALLFALGLPARVAWITQRDMPLNHVVVRLEDTGEWADPSIWGARVGETPYSALDRLELAGITHPADLAFRPARKYPMFKKQRAARPAGTTFFVPVESRSLITATLAITSPVQNASSAQNTAPRRVSGTAPQGEAVSISNLQTAQVLGEATPDIDGRWTFTLPASYREIGAHKVRAQTADGHADVSWEVTAPLAPTPQGDDTRRDPVVETTVLQITEPARDAALTAAPVAISGLAPPGWVVTLYHSPSATPEGTATADTYGAWKVAVTGLAVGSHTYVAKSGGRSAEVTFTIASAVETPPTETPPTETPPTETHVEPAQTESNAAWWALAAVALGAVVWSSMRKGGQ